MKKFAMLLLSVLMAFSIVFSLAGCDLGSLFATPSDPSDLTDPSDPADPTNLADPSDPSDPTDPTDSGQSGVEAVSEAMLMYQEAQASGYGGSFLDFLDTYGAWLEEDGPASSEPQTPTPDGAQTANGASFAALSVVAVRSIFQVLSGERIKDVVSSGAGVIYSLDRETGDAIILTNYHVVYSASSTGPETRQHISDSIGVWLYGGEDDSGKMSATFLGGAADYDIAVLAIDGDATVVTATSTHTNAEVLRASAAREITAGDSEALTIGDGVYAIGYPNSEGISVTRGVLSVKAEYILSSAILNPSRSAKFLVMRIDAAINHGNSGGGLFNERGEFVGVVNARDEETGIVGFAYAIPAALATAIADNAIAAATGGVLRANLGFTQRTESSHSVYDAATGKSDIVERVVVTNPRGAASGLLKAGDVILSVTHNGVKQKITREYQLTVLSFALRAGDTVSYGIARGTNLTTVNVAYAAEAFSAVQ